MKKRQEMEIFCFFLACTEVIFSIEGGLFKIYEISHDPLDGDTSSNRSYKLMLLFVDRLKRQSKAASMYFWSVSWSTNCWVYFSFFFWSTKKKLSSLRDRTKKFWSVSEFFSVSLSIRG